MDSQLPELLEASALNKNNRNMTRVLTAIICVLVLYACKQKYDQVDSLDFSGVEKFFHIVGMLEKDIEPSPTAWDSLFITPGYEVLSESEFSRQFFIENFSLVFMPSKRNELEESLEETKDRPFYLQHLHHYLRAKQEREEIIAYMDSMQVYADEVLAESASIAKHYLPSMDAKDYIPVSFVIFANDARGYDPVVIDILFAMDLGDKLPLLIGHELHHYYRNKMLAFDRDDIDEAFKDIMWVLDQIHAEGVADQIDKRILFSDKSSPLYQFSGQWASMVAQAPDYIRKMDETLSRITFSPGEIRSSGSTLKKELPMSGHPVGFYMANTIISEKGEKAVVADIGNPFVFFRLYNEAAGLKADGAPVFSEKSMIILGELEGNIISTEK
jgi:hypothetical protein